MKNWINGRSEGAGVGIDVLDPATLEALGTIEDCDAELVDRAVDAAATAATAWSCSDGSRRTALRTCLDLLRRHEDELVLLLSREQGKPLVQARQEFRGNARILEWFADCPVGDQILRDNDDETVIARRMPIGVVGLIVPWNFPLTILGMKLWATLRVGNTVIIKPAPTTSLTTLRMVEILGEVLPPGVINTVTGGATAGRLLSAHPRIDKISFTGSTATGRLVMAAAAPSLKRLTLELGGNDPAIVLPDADLDAIVPILLRSGFHNAGQVCQAIKRVFAPREMVDEIVSRMVQLAFSTMVIGQGTDPEVTLGPLNNPLQQRIVEELVADATQQGGKAHALGVSRFDSLPGYFVRPVVVSGLGPDARLVREEQFGPALPVVGYDNVDDLVDRLNSEEYGLDASVWSADPAAALDVARRLQVGQVYVNAHAGPPDPEIPFGGVKGSGFGRELGDRGLDDVTQLQIVKIAKPGVPV